MTVSTRETRTMESKSEIAYQWLREGISSHQFGPGYRLVLASIADVLGMSVVPVREALRRLEAEGLITFERNVGARVTVVDESAYAETMQLLGVIEGVATALSAPLLSDADLERALATNDQMERLLKHFDPRTFTLLNQQFHSALFQRCPNQQILDVVHRTWGSLAGLRDSTFSIVPDRAHHSVTEHRDIVDLIRRKADPQEIELAARQHRWRTLEAFLTRSTPRTPDRPQPQPEAP